MAIAPNSRPLTARLVNGVLAIKPIAALAKQQARSMMIKRAESIGVYWHEAVDDLRTRGGDEPFSHQWQAELSQLETADLVYPDYYLRSFHAYDEGNLGWEPAMEVEVAAHAVHARIWQDGGAQGDARLRQSYHQVLQSQMTTVPLDIVDIGCSVGMSTFALQALYPHARMSGVDLSPYFLAIAQYRAQQYRAAAPEPATAPAWHHAPAESTGLPTSAFDLVSAHLMFHELPQSAAIAILREARRLLRSGGYLAIMDMNPRSSIYAEMPPYILTLLKSTEPYLDDYFALDLEQAIYDAGFQRPTVTCNTPRHRTVITSVR